MWFFPPTKIGNDEAKRTIDIVERVSIQSETPPPAPNATIGAMHEVDEFLGLFQHLAGDHRKAACRFVISELIKGSRKYAAPELLQLFIQPLTPSASKRTSKDANLAFAGRANTSNLPLLHIS